MNRNKIIIFLITLLASTSTIPLITNCSPVSSSDTIAVDDFDMIEPSEKKSHLEFDGLAYFYDPVKNSVPLQHEIKKSSKLSDEDKIAIRNGIIKTLLNKMKNMYAISTRPRYKQFIKITLFFKFFFHYFYYE
jgi:hypothetical protein